MFRVIVLNVVFIFWLVSIIMFSFLFGISVNCEIMFGQLLVCQISFWLWQLFRFQFLLQLVKLVCVGVSFGMFGVGIDCGVIICYICCWFFLLNNGVLLVSLFLVSCICIQCVMLCVLEQMLLVLVLFDQVSGVMVCRFLKLYLVWLIVVLLFGFRWLVLQCVLVIFILLKMCVCRNCWQFMLDMCLIICWVIVYRMLLYVQFLWKLFFSGILFSCFMILVLLQEVVGQNSRLLVFRFSLL